ncbi:MAG TPA: hypothetical protein VI933_02885 [archaeon]|nr:hypothetical protein [archaeon]
MALKDPRHPVYDSCPQCGNQTVWIDGTLTKWQKCTKCKYAKLYPKERPGPKVTPMI